MDLIKKVQQYVQYLYMRYLLATELYMVDTWEKIIIHMVILIVFTALWIFNYSIVLNGLTQLKVHTWGRMNIQAV